MKIGLFIPCYVDALYPEVGVATYKLLTALGLDAYNMMPSIIIATSRIINKISDEKSIGTWRIQLILYRTFRIGRKNGSTILLRNQKKRERRTGGIHERIARTIRSVWKVESAHKITRPR